MSNLICPFCNSELHKDSDGYYTCYTDNCGCWANGGNGASGSESLWLALIRTRKALDVAVDKLNSIVDYGKIASSELQKNALGQFQKPVSKMQDIAHLAIKQITALEQKDVK